MPAKQSNQNRSEDDIKHVVCRGESALAEQREEGYLKSVRNYGQQHCSSEPRSRGEPDGLVRFRYIVC